MLEARTTWANKSLSNMVVIFVEIWDIQCPGQDLWAESVQVLFTGRMIWKGPPNHNYKNASRPLRKMPAAISTFKDAKNNRHSYAEAWYLRHAKSCPHILKTVSKGGLYTKTRMNERIILVLSAQLLLMKKASITCALWSLKWWSLGELVDELLDAIKWVAVNGHSWYFALRTQRKLFYT